MKVGRRLAILTAGAITILCVGGVAHASPHKPPPYGGGSCHQNCAIPVRAKGHHSAKDKNPSKKALRRMSAKQERGIGRHTHTGHALGKTSCHSGPCKFSVHEGRSKITKVDGVATREPMTATAGSVYCSWYKAWVYEQNFTDATLWKLTQKLSYCWQYKGGSTRSVVSHTTEVHPKIYNFASFTGWKYNQGDEKVQLSHPDGTSWSLTSHVQGHFEYCPPRIWCVQEQYPYSNVDAYGNGFAELNGWGV